MRTFVLALPLAAALVLAGCSGDADGDNVEVTTTASATATAPATNPDATTTANPQASADVDSAGDPTADAQDAEGTADLGTAAATIAVALPGEWQYEGTYGDGAAPYAVLVDASQPFDLSEPGSDAYNDSVWVRVETFRAGDAWARGTMPDNADDLAAQIADATGGDADAIDGRDVPMVHATYDEEGVQVEDLYALHDGLWILARPSNVDVDGYLDGDDVPILSNVLETATVK